MKFLLVTEGALSAQMSSQTPGHLFHMLSDLRLKGKLMLTF